MPIRCILEPNNGEEHPMAWIGKLKVSIPSESLLSPDMGGLKGPNPLNWGEFSGKFEGNDKSQIQFHLTRPKELGPLSVKGKISGCRPVSGREY